jgi:hypothetical protein
MAVSCLMHRNIIVCCGKAPWTAKTDLLQALNYKFIDVRFRRPARFCAG